MDGLVYLLKDYKAYATYILLRTIYYLKKNSLKLLLFCVDYKKNVKKACRIFD